MKQYVTCGCPRNRAPIWVKTVTADLPNTHDGSHPAVGLAKIESRWSFNLEGISAKGATGADSTKEN